ncbi:hypothetical protein BZZ01_04915 [Nostocales cyanobacterium HT-58-2]|nr:hypothetical protein BZZ01_04915 [Nostocales cyanobacterium HT-58-2]
MAEILFRLKDAQDWAQFGWQCGDTFIPNNRKCWTDEKGNKLKIPITYKAYVKRRSQVFKKAQQGYVPQTDYERRLVQSVEDRRVKIQSQKERLRLTQAAAAAGAKQILPSGITEASVDQLNLDPKRFQYKLVHGESGASGSLVGVRKWDPNLAGIIQVWRDPSDGKAYVVNGHNRVNLAKQLGVKNITSRFINAKTPEEARAVGAMTNIAEGRGNVLDAAKFFRDSGLTRTDLEKKGIPLREKIADDGMALAQLNDGLFNRVVQGDLPQERAIAVGSLIKDGKQQSELLELVEKQEKKGRKITNDTIKELAEMVNAAPKKQEEEGGLLGLLGFSPEQRSLALEKAEIQSEIKRRLSREKKLFGTVGKSSAAKDLERAGNQIDVGASKEVSEQADIALRVFDEEKNFTGSVSDALNRAAERIADGENSKKVKDEVYAEILAEIQKINPRRKKQSSGGSQEDDGDAQGSLFRRNQQVASFTKQLKRRLKRRRRCCNSCAANFSSDTYTRRTRTGKLAIVRKGKRKRIFTRPTLTGPAILGLAGIAGTTGLLLAGRGKARNIRLPVSKSTITSTKLAPAPTKQQVLNKVSESVGDIRRKLNDPNHVWEL